MEEVKNNCHNNKKTHIQKIVRNILRGVNIPRMLHKFNCSCFFFCCDAKITKLHWLKATSVKCYAANHIIYRMLKSNLSSSMQVQAIQLWQFLWQQTPIQFQLFTNHLACSFIKKCKRHLNYIPKFMLKSDLNLKTKRKR